MIVDFPYYQDVFLGRKLTEDDFPYYCKRAERYLNYFTSGKYKKVSEEYTDDVKSCICELAEQYQEFEKVQTKMEKGELISSESVGSYSVSYVTPGNATNTTEVENGNYLYAIVKKYLAYTGLLYRGIT